MASTTDDMSDDMSDAATARAVGTPRPSTPTDNAPTNAAGSVADLIAAGGERLARVGVDTPRHDAKLLLAEATRASLSDVDKAALLGDGVTKLVAGKSIGVDAALADYSAMLARRERREPLQYIVGHVPFRYLDIKVGPGVFIPRQETELLVDEAIGWVTRNGLYCPRVVDLCAGSGAIGLAIATEVPGAQVWGVEKDVLAAQWTRRNVQETGAVFPDITANYHLEIADATCPTTLAQLDGTVDVVVSNPPYIPLTDVPEQFEVREYDPQTALYGGSADGMMVPERIIVRAAALLRPDGVLIMEHDVTQTDRTVAFARASGFADARTEIDLTGRPRYLVATR
ncbi:peptide chain release factor N(5)-glutamine methyltransferase [Bifidobacterium choerinum]|uniref:peptide chain release factor N(5)-glutamine methyltransferase n=1 Tax=Bifidobacterium choerinum TaxID=35760 RepID=A0A087AIA8_9BIFI|nr:peptide chain release factor N(5)-glutamine methyltransferase [Bifidobacterium choerinum]KFI58508.1 Peptide release factor-glutamine N5-methyltransferase [Bifidobacterium choerinum]